MRFFPKTLFGRIVLIMIGGLILAQVLSTAIFFQERAHFGLRAAARHVGIRIAEIVKILDRFPAGQREGIADVINSPDLTVSIGGVVPKPTTLSSSKDEPAEIITRGLRRYLGNTRSFEVLVEGDAERETDAERSAARNLQVQVGLSDNTLVIFKSSIIEPPSPPMSSGFVFGMVIRLVTVIILSLVAVRLATQPLQTLATAAEELGRDIYRPPLNETGSLEVQRAANAFNKMQERLIQFIQERTRILAAVSHDLKTPITRLRLRAELLGDAEVRTKFVDDLEEMEAMVSATLDFTRGLDKVQPQRDVDLMALLESLQTDAQELGNEVKITGRAQRPIRADLQSLKRCIANLLDNAWKYGKHVEINVEDSDREVCISVCDAGPGIPEGEIEKVFEPFYRVEGSRNRATGGVGLGLSIARNAAHANGGDVILQNRPEGGLKAMLRLPRSV